MRVLSSFSANVYKSLFKIFKQSSISCELIEYPTPLVNRLVWIDLFFKRFKKPWMNANFSELWISGVLLERVHYKLLMYLTLGMAMFTLDTSLSVNSLLSTYSGVKLKYYWRRFVFSCMALIDVSIKER